MARWRARNLYLESKVMREGNVIVRDLLLGAPEGFPFPRTAERRMRERFLEMRDQLYTDDSREQDRPPRITSESEP